MRHSGECVEKLPHSCGTTDGLQVFRQEDGSYDGYCFSCHTYVSDPYGGEPPKENKVSIKKTKEEIDELLKEISSYPTYPLMEQRGISEDSLRHFDVHCGVSCVDGVTPETVFFPYTVKGVLSGYKIRLLKKKVMWSVGVLKDVEMFGWSQAKTSGAKTLYITEGEFDAVALYQMLRNSVAGTKWSHLIPAVVSLPFGSASVKRAITQHAHEIRSKFERVVYVQDMDEAGKLAAEEFSKLFADGYVAELPCKDANECLIKNMEKECVQAVQWKSSIPKNSRIVLGSSLKALACVKPKFGRQWPWQGLTNATRGRREGETYYFGAGRFMPA